MNKTEQNLTNKQLKAIPVVLGARSISEGVKKARISKTTFYQWLKNPIFKAEFSKQRFEVIDLALHELKASTGEAAMVLRGLLKSKNESIQLRASLGILEHVGKFLEIEYIEPRLSALEKVSKK